MGKLSKRALAALAAFALLFEIGSHFSWDNNASWKVGELSQLDRLAIRLSSQYFRRLDEDNFSLYYSASYPNTIVLTVRYKPSMDQDLLRRVIAAAEVNAKDIAHDQFGIAIKTRVDEQGLTE